MNRMRPAPRLRTAAAATLCALALAACAGDSAAPPARPPQPQTLSVSLGEHGGSITLTRQGNNYTRDGRAFSSGDTVEGTNGQTYRLTLSGNQWTAAYVAPEPSAVALGSSGEAVLVNRQEDGTYSTGGETLESGGLVTADSGNQYRLTLHRTLTGNEWRAVYVAPEPSAVTLGSSGSTISVTRNEDGSFSAGTTTFRSGETVTAANGSEYTLTLRGGRWTAAYVQPPATRVTLGTSVYSVSLTRRENGSYRLNGQPFTSGSTWAAPNGSTYRLTVNRNGEWSTAFVPGAPEVVALGTSGSTISVTRNEDGSFSAGTTTFRSGETVTAANGSEYTLTLRGGRWTAAYVQPPATRVTLGTSVYSVSLTRRENGSYRLNGQPFTSGSTWAAPNGSTYRLTVNRNGEWSTAFVPAAAEVVALGSSGGTLSVTRNENGSFSAGGAPLASGDTRTGSNNSVYRLTRQGGEWRASYVAPAPETVDLGTYGGRVTVTRNEDGSFSAGATTFRSGETVTAANGNEYTLTLRGGRWTAAYVQPPPVRVALGTSGDSVLITRQENGTYRLNGQPFTSGETRIAPTTGSTYRLTVNRNGEWSSSFEPGAAEIVVLGTSGTSIRVERREDGKYEAGGELLSDGSQRTARNGGEYRLDFDLVNRRWVATYVPALVTVELGSSGRTVVLERQEDGKYFRGTSEFKSGETYALPTGETYELTLRNGEWSAHFVPDVLQVPAGESGTILSIQRLEDGTYVLDGETIESGDTVQRGDNEYVLTLRNGQWSARFQSGTVTVDLPNNRGSVELEKREDGKYELDGRVITSGRSYRINGVLYTLRLGSRGWVATRYIPITSGTGSTTPQPATTSDKIGTRLMGNSVAVDLRADGATVANTEGTHLTVGPSDNQRQYPLGELLGEGIVRKQSTHVETAREAIQEAASSIRTRAEFYRIDLETLRSTDFGLPSLWADAQEAFGRIPGFDGTDLRAPWGTSSSRAGTGHIDEAADDLEDVVDALSSEGAFVDTYGTRYRATFEQRSASLVFGSQGQVRFGAFANHDADDQSAPWDYGNFAYSPLAAPTAGTLNTQGRATYTGDTVAVHAPNATTEPTLYDGDIALTATFSTGLVTAKITDLDDEDGDAYRYGNRDVSTIDLPAATMNSTGAFSISSGGKADLSPGPSLNQVDSEWQGQFVNGDSEAFGVWKIDADGGGEVLGSFGAGRNSRQAVPTSFEDSSGTSIRTSVFSKGTPVTTLARSGSTVNLSTTVTISSTPTALTTGFANLNLSSTANVMRNIMNGNADIGDAWLGATSATRFGAWIVPTSTGVTQAYEAFAYSPFSATPPSALAPLHFTATYRGQTRAVVLESSALSVFTGKAQVDITWDRGASSNDSLRVRLYDFSRTQGSSDALTAANLHFTKSETLGNTFSDATLDSTNSSHANLSGTPASASTRAKGSLVGSTIDGPRGVIGTWTLGVSSGESIEGSYGADLVP